MPPECQGCDECILDVMGNVLSCTKQKTATDCAEVQFVSANPAGYCGTGDGTTAFVKNTCDKTLKCSLWPAGGDGLPVWDIYVNPGQTSGGWAYLSWCGDGTLFRYCCVWYGQASCH